MTIFQPLRGLSQVELARFVDMVTATESACRSLDCSDAHVLRAKVVQLLDRHDKVKDQNVTRKEWEAIDKLNKDDTIIGLPADKGHVTLSMKTEDYLEKYNELLKDAKTYLKLKRNPTSKYNDIFVDALQDLKERAVIDKGVYKKLYPTMDQPPRFYGLPKVHKTDMPLQPILSLIGNIF